MSSRSSTLGLLPPLTTSLPFGGTLSLSSTLSVSSYTVAFPFLIMCFCSALCCGIQEPGYLIRSPGTQRNTSPLEHVALAGLTFLSYSLCLAENH